MFLRSCGLHDRFLLKLSNRGSTASIRFQNRLACGGFYDWDERAQPRLAQVESSPRQNANIDREQRLAKQRMANTQLNRDRAAQITGQQDRAQNGSTRVSIDSDTDELEYAEAHCQPQREAKFRER